MKKRILSMILCVFLLIGLLPATVFAATEISALSLKGYKAPVAGASYKNYLALTTRETGVKFYSMDWHDDTANKYLEGNETFREGHVYSVQIWMEARDGYAFKCINDNTPGITATLDGKKLTVTKAYEYKAFAMVVLSYTFPAVASAATTPTTAPTTAPTTPAHTHTPSNWRSTGIYHYRVCTQCGDMLDQEDHKGGKATCTDKGICTVCGAPYLDVTEDHVPDTSKWVARVDMYHFHPCKFCGAHCDIEDHRWSPKYHSVGEKGHAYQCADCKGYDTVQPHVAGPAGTPGAETVCKDCGYIMAPAKDHKHKLTKVEKKEATCTEPGNVEYYTCSGCSDVFSDSKGTKKLKETAVAPLGHQLSDDWKQDGDFHWRSCTVCGVELEETKMAHEPENGTCATCNYAGTVSQDVPTVPTETVPVPQKQGGEAAEFPWWVLPVALAVVTVGICVVAVAVVVIVVLVCKRRKTVK